LPFTSKGLIMHQKHALEPTNIIEFLSYREDVQRLIKTYRVCGSRSAVGRWIQNFEELILKDPRNRTLLELHQGNRHSLKGAISC
jgi:hypothetical protein